ncbi:class I adenylate-forming enzyme family protein [Halobellus salinisoli]|uniref:class I adenylate-forming enzyme family protein n=1 Tax=Halobellus salinisoli TaxID=3108500 RepID=UPI00300B8D67
MINSMSADTVPLTELSRIAAASDPNREAFADGKDGRCVTWSEFDTESNQAANAFSNYVGQGDRIAFICDASVNHVTLWNGGIKAGCVVSNLHVKSSPKTMRNCIDRLHPSVIVLDEQYSEFFKEEIYDDITTGVDAVITTGEPQTSYEIEMSPFLRQRSDQPPDVQIGEDEISSVLWTSGTTGKPKGWCLTHRSAVMRGMKLVSALNISRTTRRIQTLSPSFAAWFTGTMPAMLTGSATCFLQDWDPKKYLNLIEEKEQTMATLVPSMWREVLNIASFDEYDLGSLERITAAGERLDATTLERLESEVCGLVYNAFAATEVMATSLSNKEMDDERVESVGKPAISTEVRIIEQDGNPTDIMPPNETGEIIVKAPDSVAWAWGDTEKTQEAFVDGWWYSGDLGYQDEDGYIYLEGRSDFMILSKGIKVYPAPIEEVLNSHPKVAQSAVVGVEDDEYGEKVTAVVHRADANLTAGELDDWCLKSDNLARFERPREYNFVDKSLPRTATNKLDRAGVKNSLD